MTHQAREKFHAVPRIIDDKLIATLDQNHVPWEVEGRSSGDKVSNRWSNMKLNFSEKPFDIDSNVQKEMSFTKQYLTDHRININLRQVL